MFKNEWEKKYKHSQELVREEWSTLSIISKKIQEMGRQTRFRQTSHPMHWQMMRAKYGHR